MKLLVPSCVFPLVVHAIPSPYNNRPDAPTAVLGVICGLAGILFLFFGIRLFKIVVALAGFGIGWIVGKELARDFFPSDDFLSVVAPLGLGITVGYLCLSLIQASIVLVGVSGGLSLGLHILSWKSSGILDNSVARPILLTLLPCIGGLVSLIYERPIIIIGTSFLGSLCFCSSIDTFASTGFNQAIDYLMHNQGNFVLNDGLIALLVVYIVISILGMGVQFRVFRQYSARGKYMD